MYCGLAGNLHNSQEFNLTLNKIFLVVIIYYQTFKKTKFKGIVFSYKTQYLIFKCYNMMQRFPW